MNALDIIALTVPPDGGYGPLLAGVRGDEIPRMQAALSLNLRSREAALLDTELVKREAHAYLRAARRTHDGPGQPGWHVQTWARAHLDIARIITEAQGASWILEVGPGRLGKDVWSVRSVGPSGAFWATVQTCAPTYREASRHAARLCAAAAALGSASVLLDESGRLCITTTGDEGR